MKCKNGLDLCGFQLTNFCVQGEASAPSDAALGRKYFHTNATDDVATGISLLHRERIYLGEGAWRATAYLDDIAAINEKLNLITGDTDTDNLINNLKDLEEFLKDFSETDKLKSLLDGKLNKSGGTITGGARALTIERDDTSLPSILCFSNKSGYLGYIGFDGNDSPIIYNADLSTKKNLIHSGNIGGYAPLRKARQTTIDLNTASNGFYEIGYSAQTSTNKPSDYGLGASLLMDFRDSNGYAKIQFLGKSDSAGLWFRAQQGAGSEITSDWKTIAFTDSNVAWSQGLKHSNGTIGAVVNSSGNVTIGASDLAGTSAKLFVNGRTYAEMGFLFNGDYGIWKANRFTATAGDTAILYNATRHILVGGNVLIGTTTDDGNKLQVIGNVSFRSTTSWQNERAVLNHAGLKLYARDTGGYNQSVSFLRYDGTIFAGLFAYGRRSLVVGVAQDEPWVTFSPDGVHIKGNLIVDGEVSAGGAGTEEGTSGGGGSVDFHSEDFTPSTSTTYQVNHNLGKKVIVQVYEQGATSETWNLVMVDVEIISATRLDLRFGKIENTPHRVVVMGAGV